MNLGNKIRQIRLAKELSQENLANDIGSSTSTINRIERGTIECDHQTLMAIRKALGIEYVPLFDDERELYKSRLFMWYDLICSERLEEAKRMGNELETINFLPFEQDLQTLFALFEARLLLEDNSFKEAEEKLSSLRCPQEEMSPLNLYHYLFCKGLLNYKLGNDETALNFLLKALNTDEGATSKQNILYYYISLCFSKLGKYFHSIIYAELKSGKDGESSTKSLDLYLNNTLAVNYLQIGELLMAKKLLDICIKQARVLKNEIFIGKVIHNMGCVKMCEKKWQEAIEYLDQAFMYFKKGSYQYLENQYQKLYSITMDVGVIKAKRDTVFFKTLLESEALAIAEKSERFEILYKSLQHIMTLKVQASYEYITNVTIPYLVRTFDNYEALNYCELLKEHYQKMRNPRKSLMVSATIGEIYRNMVKWEAK